MPSEVPGNLIHKEKKTIILPSPRMDIFEMADCCM